jgi:hypothetical protein
MKMSRQLHVPVALPPDKITYFIGGWVGTRICLDAVKKRKIFALDWEFGFDLNSLILWHVDPLLGNDRKTNN